jgi:hypothetical protein
MNAETWSTRQSSKVGNAKRLGAAPPAHLTESCRNLFNLCRASLQQNGNCTHLSPLPIACTKKVFAGGRRYRCILECRHTTAGAYASYSSCGLQSLIEHETVALSRSSQAAATELAGDPRRAIDQERWPSHGPPPRDRKPRARE